MIIQHNLLAMNANRQHKINTDKSKKVAEKLSSGYKINRSADDAAGLAMSEKMRRQIRGLGQAAENIQEGIGYVQTAEGALNEVHDLLHRMNELAVKSANGTNTQQDREYIDAEVQQLKEELDRIFDTTSFNERLIWEPKPEDRVQIGSEEREAVKYIGAYSRTFDVTNDNCGVIAYSGYTINVDEANGISVSWKGYDGKDYITKNISWDELKEKDYSFDISDYFDETDAMQSALFDANGKPVFTHKVSFAVEETATVADIKDSLDGVVMSSYPDASIAAQYETSSGTAESRAVSVAGSDLYYTAAYASKASGATGAHTFDGADDAFIEPASGSSNLTSISTGSNPWEFTFEMAGIGTVKAQSTDITYYGDDTDAEDEGLWWRWQTYQQNGVLKREKVLIPKSADGTLDGVKAALTGTDTEDTPGILNKGQNGYSDEGGHMLLRFTMTSVDKYTVAGEPDKANNVGSFTLRINVSKDDTEQTVIDRINNALNNTTNPVILDLYTPNGGSSYAYERIYEPNVNSKMIDVPIWGGKCKFWVQAGTEANQHIDIEYEALSTNFLRLDGINVKDETGCADAIDRIKSAIIEVSKQRSDFGAYQNRLERAYNVNKNTQENTQASESRIRDTDMAKTMTEYSCNNILLQAGQAIMAQVNNANQNVLQLLQ